MFLPDPRLLANSPSSSVLCTRCASKAFKRAKIGDKRISNASLAQLLLLQEYSRKHLPASWPARHEHASTSSLSAHLSLQTPVQLLQHGSTCVCFLLRNSAFFYFPLHSLSLCLPCHRVRCGHVAESSLRNSCSKCSTPGSTLGTGMFSEKSVAPTPILNSNNNKKSPTVGS